jgi:uncharacterized protein
LGHDLRVLAGDLAVARLEPDALLPAWASPPPDGGPALHAIVRTAAELSVVCADAAVPDDVRAERGWRALTVAGPLDLALTGVLAALAVPLADAGVAIFAIATFDTDYLLVRRERLRDAVSALRAAGHRVTGDE